MDHAYAAAVANSGDPGEFANLVQLGTDPIQTCVARTVSGTTLGKKNPAELDAAAGLKRELRKTTYFVRVHQSSTSCFALSLT